MKKWVKTVLVGVVAVIVITIAILVYVTRCISFCENVNAVVVSSDGKIIDSGDIKFEGSLELDSWKNGNFKDRSLSGQIIGMGLYNGIGWSVYDDEKVGDYTGIYLAPFFKSPIQPYKDENGEWIYPEQSEQIDGSDTWTNIPYTCIDENDNLVRTSYLDGPQVGQIELFVRNNKVKLLLIRFDTDDFYPEGLYLIAPADNEEDVKEYINEIGNWIKEGHRIRDILN